MPFFEKDIERKIDRSPVALLLLAFRLTFLKKELSGWLREKNALYNQLWRAFFWQGDEYIALPVSLLLINLNAKKTPPTGQAFQCLWVVCFISTLTQRLILCLHKIIHRTSNPPCQGCIISIFAPRCCLLPPIRAATASCGVARLDLLASLFCFQNEHKTIPLKI